MRMLNKSEVKQIAGRAGRYGIFDVGYVNATQDRKYIHNLLDSEYEDIDLAKINFPETLLNLDEKLSETLITWSKIPDKGIFVKTDIERDLKLCRYLEQFNFDKKQMLAFINMPFDEKNENLLYMWQRMVKKFAKGTLNLKEEIRLVPTTSDLATLELAHKQFDLVFSFMKAIGSTDEEVFEKVKRSKLDIAMKIIDILKKTKTNFKRCSRCGKKLAWNYPYGICKECYHASRRYYYDYDEFFDDEDNIFMINGKELNGKQIRKIIEKIEQFGIYILAYKLYLKYGILVTQDWCHEHIYPIMQEEFPKELVKKTYPYIKIDENINKWIKENNWSHLNDGPVNKENIENMYEEVYQKLTAKD